MIIHTNCAPKSRCRKDANYVPSRFLIDSVAIKLLTKTIKSCYAYKHAENYTHRKKLGIIFFSMTKAYKNSDFLSLDHTKILGHVFGRVV